MFRCRRELEDPEEELPPSIDRSESASLPTRSLSLPIDLDELFIGMPFFPRLRGILPARSGLGRDCSSESEKTRGMTASSVRLQSRASARVTGP